MKYIYIFVLGVVISSYLQFVVANGFLVSVRRRKSHCDICQSCINISGLIPIGSYIVGRGRSECCGNKISIKYPFLEWVGGVCFLVGYDLFLQEKYTMLYLLLFLLISTFYDVEKRIVPNRFIFLTSIYVVYSNFDVHKLLLFIAVLVVVLLSPIMLNVGGADIKIIFLLGYYFNGIDVSIILLYASVFSLIYFAIFIRNSKVPIPFVPFLLLGYLLTVIH